MLLLTFL